MMKKCVIWLIIPYLCWCEHFEYSDVDPESIPRGEKSAPEYDVVMKNLFDNWRSPILYLKERGYMPKYVPYMPKNNENNKIDSKNFANYLKVPDNKQENALLLEKNKNKPDIEGMKPLVLDKEKQLQDQIIEMITNLKHNISNNNDLLEDHEILEEHDKGSSVIEKKDLLRQSESVDDNILGNLTQPEIHFIKSFINWFKKNRESLESLPLSKANGTTPCKNSYESNTSFKNKSNQLNKSKTSNECPDAKKVKPKTRPKPATSQCVNVPNVTTTTVKTILAPPARKNETCSKHPTAKPPLNKSKEKCDKNKYITKCKYLAHIHHPVDEVGRKCLRIHNGLDLDKVEEVIKKSKILQDRYYTMDTSHLPHLPDCNQCPRDLLNEEGKDHAVNANYLKKLGYFTFWGDTLQKTPGLKHPKSRKK